MKINDNWRMLYNGKEYACGDIPISCLTTLRNVGEAPDFYVGENQYAAAELCRTGCSFVTEFTAPECDSPCLVFYGVDTIADIILNGEVIGHCDNMHRTWRFPLKAEQLHETNTLEVRIASPMEYVERAAKERPIYGVDSTVEGFPHIRKAHYMYGWDWGAVIPDMGIFRDVELRESVYELRTDIKQIFSEDYSHLKFEVTPVLCAAENGTSKPVESSAPVSVSILGTTKETVCGKPAMFEIDSPELWYPRGYGEQPMHELSLTAHTEQGEITACMNVGFRSVTLSREPDSYGGREFCFVVNGVKIFARGANYIPQDNLLPLVTERRTEKLLRDMCEANCCMVRVWGGGYYPEDFFFDICDRLGLLVWEDFMFACAAYDFSDEQLKGVYYECLDNICRLKNHPSLALWCGNNEIESMWEGWGVPHDPEAKECYRKLFEYGVIPRALESCNTDLFYWPSSPSTGGGVYEGSECFKNSSTTHLGDSHYWDVWHNFKPIEEFRKHTHRFCSEFGFESLPDVKTTIHFSESENANICSNVMEAHQKCTLGNEKLMFYIAQMCHIPPTMRGMTYASQLVQAECIRCDVEHLRRNRGISMGALYWQVNDCWPVISWSSIDYFGNKKGLHWCSRRFFGDVLISCNTDDIGNVIFVASSELTKQCSGRLSVNVRDNNGAVISKAEWDITVEPLMQKTVASVDLSGYFGTREEKRTRYIEFSFECGGEIACRGTELLVRPKEFEFNAPEIKPTVTEHEDSFVLSLETDGFVKSLCINHEKYILDYSDNWFDLHKGTPKEVVIPKTARTLFGEELILTAEELERLTLTHCGNYMEI